MLEPTVQTKTADASVEVLQGRPRWPYGQLASRSMVGRFRVMSESEAAVDSDERGEASQHQTGSPRRTASNHVWKKRVPHQKRNRVERASRNQHRIRIFTSCFVVRSNDADDAENEQPTANEQPEGTRIAGCFQLLQTGAFAFGEPFHAPVRPHSISVA